jgi:archaellum component FlaC
MTAIIEDDTEIIKQQRAEYAKNYYNTNEDYRTRRIQKAREYYRTKSKNIMGGGGGGKTIMTSKPKAKKLGTLQRKTERIKKELALIEKKANAFREKLKTEANIIYDE